MPLYEYRCKQCDRVFEVMQKFSDAPLLVHEECGGEVERLISAPAFQFKGTGWYVTDYAKGKSGGGSGKSDSGKSGGSDSKSGSSDSGSSSSSDSKPAASTTPAASKD
jgi:putative FmdB family regulatory protein